MELLFEYVQPILLYTLPYLGIGIPSLLLYRHFKKFNLEIKRTNNQTEEISWWSLYERITHAFLAIIFINMIISGFILTIAPIRTNEGILGQIWNLHRQGPLLFIAFLLMAVRWVMYAVPRNYDLKWFRHMGGYLGSKEPLKAGKFNAGQKLFYWIIFLSVIIFSVTGHIMAYGPSFKDKIPLEQGTTTHLILLIIHIVTAMAFLAMFIIHLYMTIFAHKGLIKGMLRGKVNKSTALKTHSEAAIFQREN